MRAVMFYHSLVSDWNHGNAHFLRGIVAELLARGWDVRVFEPRDGWSVRNLLDEHGPAVLERFASALPALRSERYALDDLELDAALAKADLVLVHEWSDPELIRRIGEHRAAAGEYRLFFHDTHHRAVTRPDEMARYDLRHYDGVLAFGERIRQRYLEMGWAEPVFTWHEAADTRVFHPLPRERREGDLIWVGNWGDDERTAELEEFLIEPVEALGLRARIHGVRYPPEARDRLRRAGIQFSGWIPNYDVPRAFSAFDVTVHVPRGPYVRNLPGIPTIRVFEALACGIPLVCSPWEDAEGLFTPGSDFLVARNGAEMRRHLAAILNDRELAAALAVHGLATIRDRHTCAHRVDELLGLVQDLAPARREFVA